MPRALRVPEDAEPPLIVLDLADGCDGVIDAEELVVLSDLLDEPAAYFFKDREVLDDVEEPRRLADAAQNSFKRDDPGFFFVRNLLPLEEVFPLGGQRADACLAAVGKDDEGVGRKSCGIAVL